MRSTSCRVEEKFRTEVRPIPFDRQVLRNESLPEGEERLVQVGVNGQEELTYRAIFEDGVQVNEGVIKTVRLTEPSPEIVMLGSRLSLSPLSIPGLLAYLSAGNAWIMETSTSNRRVVVNSGDLDGRVFELSPDRKYLLFTRKSTKPADQEINTLWIAPTDPAAGRATSLEASNIVHFAAWFPNSSTRVAYSTVEPRSNAPGWQANNDLYRAVVGGPTNEDSRRPERRNLRLVGNFVCDLTHRTDRIQPSRRGWRGDSGRWIPGAGHGRDAAADTRRLGVDTWGRLGRRFADDVPGGSRSFAAADTFRGITAV